MYDSTVKSLKTKPKASIKLQVLASVSAIIGAVTLPQLFHIIGNYTGLGTSLGEIFLPMHFPVILAALLAGPYVGLAAGILSPLMSFLLSGMPGTIMLPFMIIELSFYGVSAGILRNIKTPTVFKVLAIQITGRIARSIAILSSIYVLGNNAVQISIIWNSIKTGAIGIVFQIILLPVIIYAVNHKRNINNE